MFLSILMSFSRPSENASIYSYRRARRKIKRNIARKKYKLMRPVTWNNRVYNYRFTVIPSGPASIADDNGGGGSYNSTIGYLYGPTSTAFTGFNFTFTAVATDIPNWTQFAAIYDMYKINKIVLDFYPSTNVTTNQNDAGQDNIGYMGTVLDYDDANLLSAESSYTQYQTLKYCGANQHCKRIAIPAVSAQIFQSSISTGYASKKKQWLDVAYDTIPHYMLKGFIQSNNVSKTWAQICYRVRATYYVSFKIVR